jgi:hypothetical protein
LSQIKSLTSLYSLAIVLVLTGCGFQPLYRALEDDKSLSKLEQVKVDVIADRSGQILRNYLLDTMTADSRPSNKYLLKVTLTETTRKLGVRRDETASHEQITINAALNLENMETGKTEYTDVVTQVASFSVGRHARTAAYSASVSEDSSREKALKIISDDINLRVASHFLNKDKK